MLLALVDANGISIAHKKLETAADFRRISNANMLEFQGQYYGFSGVDKEVIIFQLRSSPVSVEGFVTKLPQ
jgi:hypothetical protein